MYDSRDTCRHASAATYRRRDRPLRDRVGEEGEQRGLLRLVGGQMEEHPELMAQAAVDVQSQVRGKTAARSVELVPRARKGRFCNEGDGRDVSLGNIFA